MQYIAFDSHKHYTVARVEGADGTLIREAKIQHARGALRVFLAGFEAGSPVAVETIGNWYWIIEEIEAAQMRPQLVHARKAKLMMGQINKTDKLDARGLNRLQRTGTLPTVWIPPAELRDRRDLTRTRMVLVGMRTRLKNRIHANLAKYAVELSGLSDLFGATGRRALQQRLAELPAQARYVTEQLLEELDGLDDRIDRIEARMSGLLRPTEEIRRLMTLPGVGFILASVVALEVGDAERFPSAVHLASYAGTTPRIHSSGGKTRYGPLRSDVNRYLKWAFVEAANVTAIHHRRWSQRHVSQRYQRLCANKGHQKAIGAVARHLAEATYWMLRNRQDYREPQSRPVSSTRA